MKMQLYELKNNIYSAVINLSRGANCISLRNNKYDVTILREPKDFSVPPDSDYLYGMPVLFPVNRISGGKFTFEGREYTFPINEPATGCHLHGTLHQQEFQVAEGGTDYVVCSYRATKEAPYQNFQHEFELTIRYYLKEDGLEQITEVKNLSALNMPVMIGFHTTFQLPFLDGQTGEDFSIHADVTDEIERNMAVYLPTGKLCPVDVVTEELRTGTFCPFTRKISRHYKAGSDGILSIYDKSRGLKIRYENSNNMKFRLLYNGNADSYICLEPQNCLIDCVNNQSDFSLEYSGFEYAKPFESKIYWSKISVDLFP